MGESQTAYLFHGSTRQGSVIVTVNKKGLDTEGYVVLQPGWQAVAAAPLCDSNWHHVAVTYEKASQTFSLFVDYRLVGSKAGVAIEASSNQFPLQGMVVAAVAALSLAAWACKPPGDTQDGETRTLTFGVRAKPGRVLDAQLMAEMAEGTSRAADAAKYRARADAAHAYLKQAFFATEDGTILPVFKRWNSYTKKDGFGPVGMNSFNHYAYGAVLAWMYKTMAGIAADPKAPGFRNVVMAPVPDRRLGFVKAEYRSSAGLVKSAWRYKGDEWIWEFTVPAGATATVTVPGEKPRLYGAGSWRIVRRTKDSSLQKER